MNGEFMNKHQVRTRQELRELIGEPIDVVKDKKSDRLEDDMKAFISTSSLIFISTIDATGIPDISPKGDPAGFVFIEGDSTIHIPDRPGNRLMYGFNNILDNPSIGVIFVTPNSRETLRIKGKAAIHKDPELLEKMSVNGKPALLSTSIQIEECFFHCGKAMIRSDIWNPESWGERGKSVMVKQMAKKFDADKELEELIESEIEKN
jgi:PPOX class probable FMN-dependent enzyme